MSNNNLLTSDNVSVQNQIQECKVICIFIDIRNSTKLNNDIKDKKKLKEIYNSVLNNSYFILHSNGFKNIQIQGDGIYGLIEYNSNKIATIKKCINKLESNLRDAHQNHNIFASISVCAGNELYGTFGETENKHKQLAYFGNVVSNAKKINNLAFRSIIIIKINGFKKEDLDNLYNENNSSDIWLKYGGKYGKIRISKW